ncbi:MAG: sensor histidine kinase [Pseudomonadales bacterium]|nr:sensor histidine kinase [Pseudomonadales bacterium]
MLENIKVTKSREPIDCVGDTNTFLPDFCQGRTVFVLVLVAELFVLTMVLASSGIKAFSWDYLALVSLFVQWVALLSAMLLCVLRHRLGRLSLPRTVTIVYLLILCVTAIATIVADWVMAGANFYDLNLQVDGYGLMRNLMISAIMTGMVLRYLYVQANLRRQERAELQARVQALQSRIRPHFLFNSMNIIASLIETHPDTAERVVEDLSELFRASLAGADSPVRLSREIELCKRYIGIEQLRLGERLQVNWRVESYPPSATIPLLTLQPLIENAIYHGIQPQPEGGQIGILIQHSAGLIQITVSNPCRHDADSDKEAGNHIALDNIRARMRAVYGVKARLTTHLSKDIFVTQLSYPLVGD